MDSGKIKINKNLFAFDFLQGEELFLGNVEDYQVIPQEWDFPGMHHKLWIDIKGLPFLVVGYEDEEYSAVNRVLASQIGKLLGLNTEEVFLAFNHGKCVNLIPFKPCISLAENKIFEMYELNALDYPWQDEEKRALNFLIQNIASMITVSRQLKQKFTENFVDEEGNVFITNLAKAMFLTPKQIPATSIIPFEINDRNFQVIRKMVDRVKKIDLVDVAFESLPGNFVELHDMEAYKLHKPNFYQKKDCFDSNWNNLLQSLVEFESMIAQGRGR